MGMPLFRIFGGMFLKQGWTVKEHPFLSLLEIENEYIKGMVSFSTPIFKVRWICKDDVQLFDCPIAFGHTSSQFSSAKDLLDFLQRRLVWKKQK